MYLYMHSYIFYELDRAAERTNGDSLELFLLSTVRAWTLHFARVALIKPHEHPPLLTSTQHVRLRVA